MQTLPASASNARLHTLGTVIITGGASGLGRAIADAVALAGGKSVTFDVKPAPNAAERENMIVDCGDRSAIEAAVADVAVRTASQASAPHRMPFSVRFRYRPRAEPESVRMNRVRQGMKWPRP